MLKIFLKYLRYNRLVILKGLAALQSSNFTLKFFNFTIEGGNEILSSDTSLDTFWNSDFSSLNFKIKESESALLVLDISNLRALIAAIISSLEVGPFGEDSLLLAAVRVIGILND